jgi:hypothetical protein
MGRRPHSISSQAPPHPTQLTTRNLNEPVQFNEFDRSSLRAVDNERSDRVARLLSRSRTIGGGRDNHPCVDWIQGNANNLDDYLATWLWSYSTNGKIASLICRVKDSEIEPAQRCFSNFEAQPDTGRARGGLWSGLDEGAPVHLKLHVFVLRQDSTPSSYVRIFPANKLPN